MSQTDLEVTYRNGWRLAAYYYLPRRPGDRASRTSAPSMLSLATMNRVLRELGQRPINRTELSPLLAA